ncbi:cytochrome c-552 [Striga asiatica]|uniref:Cytochrome c-552 n=1 Tax=Striga asiatica TaxID=4170 RepID=A0A5A7QQZ8_STRAF|nr:cytochrome c-552 [Striga asiatica]
MGQAASSFKPRGVVAKPFWPLLSLARMKLPMSPRPTERNAPPTSPDYLQTDCRTYRSRNPDRYLTYASAKGTIEQSGSYKAILGLVPLSGGLAGGADRGKTMGIDGIADNRFPLRGRRP